MVPHPLKGVLFDMDGTLVDAFHPIILAIHATLQHFGRQRIEADEIRRQTGRGDCTMRALFGDDKEAATEHFLKIHDDYLLEGIATLDGVEPLLQHLQTRAIPMAIVTSKGQLRAEAQINHLGLSDYFDCIIGKQPGLAEKPSPEPILRACSVLKCSPSQAIMIGDGISDTRAAKAAQVMSLAITSSFSVEELTQTGAAHCFPTLSEVSTWLMTQIR
ncbi:MAG: HAD family hydrolase [Zetaproteobacteria bacterium]|nr:HAD family hydrolase [Zetaproteobacteria bacterium]